MKVLVTMTDKQKYSALCKEEKGISIFSKDWWLDAVCDEGNWNVILVEKGGQIVASMPYYLKRESMFTTIVMPKLTQTMELYIKYPPEQKYYKKLSWEKELITSLIEQLPQVDSFNQFFNYSITNWLPFYWNGFKQSTRYTYIIDPINREELELFLETDGRRRRRRKAKRLGVTVIEGNDIKVFYELNKKTFQRQGLKIPYTFEYIDNLYNVCKKNNACKMFFAKDNKNEIIAANFLVYDSNTVYYLMGGIEPSKKDLGGMDVVQHESIKFAIENGKKFDFEGSMIESIEKYFRSFGAIQKPYFQIYKTNSKLWKVKKLLDRVLKK